MTDEHLKQLGRKVLRDAAKRTTSGRLAAQIGEMLYDGIGHHCDCRCARREADVACYKEQVTTLTAIQGYLEKLADDEAAKLVWMPEVT